MAQIDMGPERTAVIATDEVEVCKAVLEPLIPLRLVRIPVATVDAAEEWLLGNGTDVDLAVVDLSLGADVVELIENMHAARPDIPVVLLSTTAQRQTAARLLGLGAFSYVMKPVYPDEIRVHVERALKWTRRVDGDDEVGEERVVNSDARGRSA